jgi:hypothetical protein
MDLFPSSQYETFEGEATRLASATRAVMFRLAGRNLMLMARRPPPLCEGEYVRVLALRVAQTGTWRVKALQRRGSARIEYVGRRSTLYGAAIAALGFTTGFYGGIWWLMFLSTLVMLLGLPALNQEHDVERRFEAYCRTCPAGTLRS